MRVLLFILLAINVSAQSSGSRPNIIYILADDLGQNEISRNNGLYDTPNIDFLCDNGAYYERFYVDKACTQTRSEVLTGRHDWKTGMSELVKHDHHDHTLPSDTLTLPQKLRELGYVTGIVGKWHLGDEPWSRSRYYDFSYSWEHLQSGPNYYTHLMNGGFNLNENGICQDTATGTYGTHLITDKSVEFIESMSNTDNPFFLYIPYTAPHTPLQCPYGTGGDDIKRCMVEQLDEGVGKIYDAVANNGLLGNTLIVFGSDNGSVELVPSNGLGNEPYRGYKNGVYEGGVNTPCVFYWDGVISSQVVGIQYPTHVADLYPTFVDLAGGVNEAYVDGSSLLPIGSTSMLVDRLVPVVNFKDALDRWQQCIAYNEFVFVDPLANSQSYQMYNLLTDLSQTNDLVGNGLPEETILLEHSDAIKSQFVFQFIMEDNVAWYPPRCYGHEHRRDDFYKDEYIPLEFIAN